jgi:hypothetical protein
MSDLRRATERAELPGPRRFERYLLKQGWKLKPFERREIVLFEGPDDDEGVPILQLLPRSWTAADYHLRAEELMRALSVIENRPEAEILAAIREGLDEPELAAREVGDVDWPRATLRFVSVSILALTAIGASVLVAQEFRNATLPFLIAFVVLGLLCSMFAMILFSRSPLQPNARSVCVAGDVMIDTVQGSKRIDQIRRGDSVWSWDQRANKRVVSQVRSIDAHQESAMYELHLERSELALRATGYHSFLTQRGWVRCDHLRPGDCLASISRAGELSMRKLARIQMHVMCADVYSLRIGYPGTFVCGGVVAHSFTAFRWIRTLLSA